MLEYNEYLTDYYVLINWSHANVMRLSFVKCPDGLREEAPPKSFSYCHHALVAFARWQ